MPDTNTVSSRRMPSSGISSWTAARRECAPQPGHRRTPWSRAQSVRVGTGIVVSLMACPSRVLEVVDDRLLELGGRERQAAHLADRLGVDEEAGPQLVRQLAEV